MAIVIVIGVGSLGAFALVIAPALIRCLGRRRHGSHTCPSTGDDGLALELQQYPMYVLPIRALLELRSPMRSHQQLLAEGILVQATGRELSIVFVSSERLGAHHPDSRGEQLRALQSTLKRLMVGDTETVMAREDSQDGAVHRISGAEWERRLRDAYVWVEFMSTPQPGDVGELAHTHGSLSESARARASVGAYIDRSWLLLVLAPPVVGSDGVCRGFASWLEQGWR